MKRRGKSSAASRDYETRMLRVLAHIQEHLDEPLELETLARVSCFSRFHFHRIFTGSIGESVKSHVRRLRLERAAVQLKHTPHSVMQIALAAGFESHEAFTRAFKAGYGSYPSRYRALKKPASKSSLYSEVHFRDGGELERCRVRSSPEPSVNVQIKTIPPRRVAFMRHVGPYSKVAGLWDNFLPLLGKEGWLGGDSQFIGICHDDPDVTPANKLRYDACVTVDHDFKPFANIGAQSISGGLYAVTTHCGPYRKLGATYGLVFSHWLPGSGRSLRSAPCFEVYVNSPENTEPQDLLTDIYLPLEPV